MLTKDNQDATTAGTLYAVDLGEVIKIDMAEHVITAKGHVVRRDYEPMTPFLASIPVKDCYGSESTANAIADAFQTTEYRRLEDRFGFLKRKFGIDLAAEVAV